MTETPYQNLLTIKFDGKGIPYGGQGVARTDGSANYGFKDIKGRPERIAEIPELQDDSALRQLVTAINRNDTGLFSIGCVSDATQYPQGYGHSGYIEIAWDSCEQVSDMSNYFPLFFHFARFLKTSGFDRRVKFLWELMGANFSSAGLDMQSVSGSTAAIFVSAGLEENAAEALRSWEDAMSVLGAYLGTIPPQPGRRLTPIYELPTKYD